ncbi:uncharacterized protein [Dendropsophus ebraccatus]|uniref:uncharacterized protein n=1 Tax=Dendropsophus ebraccatus TaxID=150705 RepID=UPI0038323238
MKIETFDDLLLQMRNRLTYKDTTWRKSIPPDQRLLVTLRYLATGESFSSLHYQFRMGKSTISKIIHHTCKELWNILQPIHLPHPDPAIWKDIAEGFFNATQFPNCVGALDGKHIRIQKPANSGSMYYNYKKFFSIILMALADHTCKFIAVDIGAYGGTNDARVFNESNLGKLLYSGQLGLPPPQPLPATTEPSLPFVIVADDAFRMGENILKPYSSRQLDSSKRTFNYRLTRARRVIECAFGILAGKWRILNKAIQLTPEGVTDVVKACVVLHNFIISKESMSGSEETDCNLLGLQTVHVRSAMGAITIREKFRDYFVSEEGRIPWQNNYI